MIPLTEEIIEYKTFLKFFKKKTKVEKYTKLGELIKENTSARITKEEEEKINFILDNVKNKETFKENMLKNQRKKKLKTVI